MAPQASLALESFKPARIVHGGYHIVFTYAGMPSGTEFHIWVGPPELAEKLVNETTWPLRDNQNRTMKLAAAAAPRSRWVGFPHGVHPTGLLASFLALIGNQKLWSEKGPPCQLAARMLAVANKEILAVSPEIGTFYAPVKPLTCRGDLGTDPEHLVDRHHHCHGQLNYPKIGKSWAAGTGSTLSEPIGGCRYFLHGGMFVADEAHRGFDCTSFVHTVLDISPGVIADPEPMAKSIGADAILPPKPGTPGSNDWDFYKDFLARPESQQGDFILFMEYPHPTKKDPKGRGGHCVVVRDGSLYEFTEFDVSGGGKSTDDPRAWMESKEKRHPNLKWYLWQC